VPPRTVVDFNIAADILSRLDDIAEGRTPPAPSEVRDYVGRVGNEWSIVGGELARLV